MLADRAEEAARLLCAARSGQPIAELPADCRPQSDADAYQIQDAVTRRLGETVGGWKVGAASEIAPAFCAPIFARMIRQSPASYDSGRTAPDRDRRRNRVSPRPRFAATVRAIRQRRCHRRRDLAPGYRGRRLAFRRDPRTRPARNARRQLRKWWARLGYCRSGLEEARSQPHRDPHHRRWPAIRG